MIKLGVEAINAKGGGGGFFGAGVSCRLQERFGKKE